MRYVRKVAGQWTEIRGNPTLDRSDGSGRAPFTAVVAPGWPEGHAAAFGVFSVDVDPPEGQFWTGGFIEQDGLPVAVFEPKPAPTVEDYRLAVSQHVDATAQSRDYDNAVSLASYVASTNATYAAEAQAFVAWRDAVWADVIQRLNAVQAGTQAPPESPAALIADLPQVSWPT